MQTYRASTQAASGKSQASLLEMFTRPGLKDFEEMGLSRVES